MALPGVVRGEDMRDERQAGVGQPRQAEPAEPAAAGGLSGDKFKIIWYVYRVYHIFIRRSPRGLFCRLSFLSSSTQTRATLGEQLRGGGCHRHGASSIPFLTPSCRSSGGREAETQQLRQEKTTTSDEQRPDGHLASGPIPHPTLALPHHHRRQRTTEGTGHTDSSSKPDNAKMKFGAYAGVSFLVATTAVIHAWQTR